MPFDVKTPESPGWWLVRLLKRLQDEAVDVERLENLYEGRHRLAIGDEELDLSDFQEMARSNYLSLVVEAVVERQKVVGFRSGDGPEGDDETWKLWQSANLDADQTLLYRTARSCRRAYVIVGPHPRKRDKVLATVEHPSQVTVETYPEDDREVRAALKFFKDDILGLPTAYLYLPTAVVKFRARSAGGALTPAFFAAQAVAEWEVVSVSENPTAPEVPVVEFGNRPTLLGRCRAEFEDVVPIQNRINQTLLHRLVAEKFASFRQTAILNIALEEDEDGEPTAPDLPTSPGLAWLLQGEHLAMWQSEQTDTAAIIKAVETDIRDLAAITRTPPHYLLNSIVNASGDALKSAETGLVAKVKERNLQDGESWEQVVHLMHVVAGTGRAAESLEVVWADPESRSLAEVSDAVLKQKDAGVPWRMRMEQLGYSPPEIDRMEADRAADALLASFALPPEPTPAAAPASSTEEPPDPAEAA